jgi:hypothetical protein
MFESIMRISLNQLYAKNLVEGSDLRRIGVTFTLLYLCEKLVTDPAQAKLDIIQELNRIEKIIRRNVVEPKELLSIIATLKKEGFSKEKIPQLKVFHRQYVIEVLKAFLHK